MKCQNCGKEYEHLTNGLCDTCLQLASYEKAVRERDDEEDVEFIQPGVEKNTYDSFIESGSDNQSNIDKLKENLKNHKLDDVMALRMWVMNKLIVSGINQETAASKMKAFYKLAASNIDKIYGVKVDLVVNGENESTSGKEVIIEDKENGIKIVKAEW